MRRLDGITDSMDMSLRKLWKMVKDRDAAVHEVAKSQTQLSNRTISIEHSKKSHGHLNRRRKIISKNPTPTYI